MVFPGRRKYKSIESSLSVGNRIPESTSTLDSALPQFRDIDLFTFPAEESQQNPANAGQSPNNRGGRKPSNAGRKGSSEGTTPGGEQSAGQDELTSWVEPMNNRGIVNRSQKGGPIDKVDRVDSNYYGGRSFRRGESVDRGGKDLIAQQERVLGDLVGKCMKVGPQAHSMEHRHMCRKAVTAASAFRDGPKLFISLIKDALREVRKISFYSSRMLNGMFKGVSIYKY